MVKSKLPDAKFVIQDVLFASDQLNSNVMSVHLLSIYSKLPVMKFVHQDFTKIITSFQNHVPFALPNVRLVKEV